MSEARREREREEGGKAEDPLKGVVLVFSPVYADSSTVVLLLPRTGTREYCVHYTAQHSTAVVVVVLVLAYSKRRL